MMRSTSGHKALSCLLDLKTTSTNQDSYNDNYQCLSRLILSNTSKEVANEPDDLQFFILRNNFLSNQWNANQIK